MKAFHNIVITMLIALVGVFTINTHVSALDIRKDLTTSDVVDVQTLEENQMITTDVDITLEDEYDYSKIKWIRVDAKQTGYYRFSVTSDVDEKEYCLVMYEQKGDSLLYKAGDLYYRGYIFEDVQEGNTYYYGILPVKGLELKGSFSTTVKKEPNIKEFVGVEAEDVILDSHKGLIFFNFHLRCLMEDGEEKDEYVQADIQSGRYEYYTENPKFMDDVETTTGYMTINQYAYHTYYVVKDYVDVINGDKHTIPITIEVADKKTKQVLFRKEVVVRVYQMDEVYANCENGTDYLEITKFPYNKFNGLTGVGILEVTEKQWFTTSMVNDSVQGSSYIQIYRKNNDGSYMFYDGIEYNSDRNANVYYSTQTVLIPGTYYLIVQADADIDSIVIAPQGMKASIEATAITMPTSLTIMQKDTYSLGADVVLTPTIANSGIMWSSDNEKVVKVSSTGKLTALAPGKAKITATSGKAKAVCNVTVISYKDQRKTPSLSFEKNDVTKVYGTDSFQNACVVISDGKAKYTSSNSKVATVDQKGKITITGVGVTYISVETEGTELYKPATAKFKLTVSKGKQQLSVKTTSFKVAAKKLKKKKASTSKLKVAGAKTELIFKKKSGSKKLSVNKKTGKITVKKGTAKGIYKIKVKITAAETSNYVGATKTITCKVKVK